MPPLPDDAFVVRGGENQPDNFTNGAEAIAAVTGLLFGVSTQSAPGKSVHELVGRIINGQIGVSTVGAIRAAGGEVIPDPSPGNPDHSLLSGLDAETASRLFTPTIRNPNRVR